MDYITKWTYEELADLLFAGILMSVIFVIAYEWTLWVAFMVGAFGLIIHELGHKIAGLALGIKDVHFMISPFGMAVGFFSSLAIGHALVAPGGVTHGENGTPRRRFLMGAAGPIANLIVFFIFIWLGQTRPVEVAIHGGEVNIWFAVAFVNLYLGAFNMLPIPMFDGSHLFRINKMWWAIFFVTLISMVVVLWSQMVAELSIMFSGSWSGLVGVLLQHEWGIWILPIVPSLLIARHLEIGLSDIVAHTPVTSDYIEL